MAVFTFLVHSGFLCVFISSKLAGRLYFVSLVLFQLHPGPLFLPVLARLEVEELRVVFNKSGRHSFFKELRVAEKREGQISKLEIMYSPCAF